jgi:tRNA 5-methylaminomethyl-2-thiouridine biosynthesis bifunctional protein
MHRFVLAAYGHALSLLDDVLPVDQELRGECGLLQLAFDDAERKRIARLASVDWPAHLLRFVDDREATRLAGIAMSCGGMWFPAGGWVVPAAAAANLANDARVTRRLGRAVETLQRTATGWHVGGRDADGNDWHAEPEVVVACSGHSARSLAPFAHLPLSAVRGQITLLPATASSRMLRTVVCGDCYCTPEQDGMHLAGATHGRADESMEMRRVDHVTNLSNLARYAPQLRHALGDVDPDRLGGRASVRCSAPGAMPLVGRAQTGLYCSLAHGTRGMITAGLAGEVIAAQICGQLPPLPTNILAALAPASGA